jgi:hypothetical protein
MASWRIERLSRPRWVLFYGLPDNFFNRALARNGLQGAFYFFGWPFPNLNPKAAEGRRTPGRFAPFENPPKTRSVVECASALALWEWRLRLRLRLRGEPKKVECPWSPSEGHDGKPPPTFLWSWQIAAILGTIY